MPAMALRGSSSAALSPLCIRQHTSACVGRPSLTIRVVFRSTVGILALGSVRGPVSPLTIISLIPSFTISLPGTSCGTVCLRLDSVVGPVSLITSVTLSLPGTSLITIPYY